MFAKYQTHIRNSYREPNYRKFDDCTSEILKNLAAEDNLDRREWCSGR